MSPGIFTWGLLMKIEWLVADVTHVGGPDRAEHDIFEMILNIFWSIQATFVAGKTLCDVGILS